MLIVKRDNNFVFVVIVIMCFVQHKTCVSHMKARFISSEVRSSYLYKPNEKAFAFVRK